MAIAMIAATIIQTGGNACPPVLKEAITPRMNPIGISSAANDPTIARTVFPS
jgi:hypothetical protein